MVNKKLNLMVMLGLSTLLLTACGNLGSSSGTTTNTNEESASSGYQTTGQTNDSEYTGVIINGRYRTNKSRGVGVSQNSENLLNLKSFESGLTDISKEYFSTKDYVFQEGQTLSKSTVEDWLARKSSKNPDGLNPEDNGKNGENERNPMYVQQIEEQDYMKEDSKGNLSLAGITVGIGMNRKDYYQKEEYGATYVTNISKEEMEKQGKIAAAKVVARLRAKVGNDVPIVVAMYQQAEMDSLVGGSFYAYTEVKAGSSEITNWTDTDISSYVFPATSTKSVPNDNDEAAFESFKNKIQNFFPNLAGVTAQAKYKGKNLQGLKVTITTQFYSETEITSFTQYVAKAAKTYLPSGIPVDIQVKGSDGTVQSFLAKTAKESSYYTHVFTSY
ncbi:CamS family sex pheromone protein [Ligilactobacillus agilis]